MASVSLFVSLPLELHRPIYNYLPLEELANLPVLCKHTLACAPEWKAQIKADLHNQVALLNEKVDLKLNLNSLIDEVDLPNLDLLEYNITSALFQHLTTLDAGTLTRLQESDIPHCDHIPLARVLQTYSEAEGATQRGEKLNPLCQKLIQEHRIAEGLLVTAFVKNMPQQDGRYKSYLIENKHSIIQDLFSALVINQQLRQAKKLGSMARSMANKNMALTGISTGFASTQQFDQAIQTAHLISDRAQTDCALLGIVKYLVANEELDRAVEIASTIKYYMPQGKAFGSIFNPLIQGQKFDRAIDLIHKTPEEPWTTQAIKLCTVARAMFEIQQQPRAFEVMQQAIESAEKLPSSEDINAFCCKDTSFRVIAEDLAKMGQFNRAEEIAHMIQWESKRLQMLRKIGALRAASSTEEKKE
jgi:hypothetical protein